MILVIKTPMAGMMCAISTLRVELSSLIRLNLIPSEATSVNFDELKVVTSNVSDCLLGEIAINSKFRRVSFFIDSGWFLEKMV